MSDHFEGLIVKYNLILPASWDRLNYKERCDWIVGKVQGILTDGLHDFQDRNGLPRQCAFEQLHEDGLTDHQRRWLTRFVALWEEAR